MPCICLPVCFVAVPLQTVVVKDFTAAVKVYNKKEKLKESLKRIQERIDIFVAEVEANPDVSHRTKERVRNYLIPPVKERTQILVTDAHQIGVSPDVAVVAGISASPVSVSRVIGATPVSQSGSVSPPQSARSLLSARGSSPTNNTSFRTEGSLKSTPSQRSLKAPKTSRNKMSQGSAAKYSLNRLQQGMGRGVSRQGKRGKSPNRSPNTGPSQPPPKARHKRSPPPTNRVLHLAAIPSAGGGATSYFASALQQGALYLRGTSESTAMAPHPIKIPKSRKATARVAPTPLAVDSTEPETPGPDELHGASPVPFTAISTSSIAPSRNRLIQHAMLLKDKKDKIQRALAGLATSSVTMKKTKKPLAVFATFTTRRDAVIARSRFSYSWLAAFCHCSSHDKLRGRYTIRVKPAPKPSSILWENLPYSWWNRALRWVCACFVPSWPLPW